jgi:beta-ureidopropionase / N-carbamoyl-L-amino-acid hydrolase
VIDAEMLAAALAELDDIGAGPDGIHRLAWTAEDAATRAWFERQAELAGLEVMRDPAGNLWACPDATPPWPAVGSHLDSVRGGGRFDGPLGVACAFAVADASEGPVAVISFADEEGARFNTPTFGSKALVSRLDLPRVLERRDEHGVALREAMRRAGVDPERIGEAPGWLNWLTAFLEIHIDQCRAVDEAGVPVSIVSALAARRRLEVVVEGQADHAGTTPPAERRDALAAAARLLVAADEAATDGDPRVTTARMLIEPNAATTIAGQVHAWIDARSADAGRIDAWQAELERRAAELAERSRTTILVSEASRSPARTFDPTLRGGLGKAAEDVVGRRVPEHVCFAGHDAGVLVERIPAAMVLVRNPTGVSHSPAESVDLADAAVAAEIVARIVAELAG